MSSGMFAAVAAGGALGAMTRYAVSLAVGGGIFGVAGPLVTLGVNVVGSAIMGGFAGVVAAGIVVPEMWRGFVAIGFLGALTTFSSFALDTGTLLARQGYMTSALYIGLSVGLSLVAFFAVQAAVASLLARGAG
ncbi:MAG: fluoride efflux transporter FluC [Candidatus Puniceispirillaceae bacterium]